MRAVIDDAELSYSRHGSGPPLFVLGGIHLDHSYLRPWLDALGELVELVYVDVRGAGRSARPATFEGMTHETWVDDVDALRRELGHERILLFGHSYGGYLAQEYALRHGDTLQGLILCCTAPALDHLDVSMVMAQATGTPEQVADLTAAFSAPIPTDEEMKRLWLRVLPLYFREYHPTIADRFSDGIHYSAAAFNHGFFTCLPSFNTVDRLHTVDVTTLVLGGRYDWIAPPEQGSQRLHDLLECSELTIFERSGHFPFIEEAVAFSDRVSCWLTDQL